MTDSFRQHKEQGNDLYRQQKYHAAIREYTQCIQLDSTNHLPYANRAMCKLKIGKYEDAEADCSECIRRAPKYVKGYLRRGAARKALGTLKASLSDYEMALHLQPKNTEAKIEVQGLKAQIDHAKQSLKTTAAANSLATKKKHGRNSKRQTKIRKIQSTMDQETLQKFESQPQKQDSTAENDTNKIFYGQWVVGPPGSGKTTYCHVIAEYMTNVLRRNVAVINLDPNNENMRYHPFIDIRDLISADDAAQQFALGPNGALLYCVQYLSANMAWLRQRLNAIAHSNTYLIFDCPGQIELYVHHESMRRITKTIVDEWHYRLACVNLVDCHHCCSDTRTNDCSNFISVALMTTSMMLHLELPHVNILSKCDLIEHYDQHMTMPLDFYTDSQDLELLTKAMYNNQKDAELTDMERKFKRLNNELAQCINDYGLVSFIKLSVVSEESVRNVCKLVDKANGYDLLGAYYEQMELEQKIIEQRLQETQETNNDDQGNESATTHLQEQPNESNCEDMFSVKNPLLKNTPFI